MVGANRILVLDASWNPSDDTQAIFRAYRYGQLKPVYVYRLLAHATMEEKIYDRQVNKISLASRVVDEQNLERHFNESDLKALYEFKPEKDARKTPAVPKDRLLAEMLMKHKTLIQGYHEHDSLLQKELEDELTEDERKTAWKEYEDERDGKVNPGTYNVPMGNAGLYNMGNAFNSQFSPGNLHSNVDPTAYQAWIKAQQERNNAYVQMYLNAMRQKIAAAFQYPPTNVSQKSREELLKRPPHFNFKSSHPSLNPQEILDDVKLRNPDADQLSIAALYRTALCTRRDQYVAVMQRTRQSIEAYTKQRVTPPKACLDMYQEFESAVLMLNALVPKLDEAITGARTTLQKQTAKSQQTPVIDLSAAMDDDVQVIENPSTSQRSSKRNGPIIEEID